jgi:hypothetical protein
MWLVPGVVLGVATTFLQLAWLLSFSMWGLMWMGQPTTWTSLRSMGGRLGHKAL